MIIVVIQRLVNLCQTADISMHSDPHSNSGTNIYMGLFRYGPVTMRSLFMTGWRIDREASDFLIEMKEKMNLFFMGPVGLMLYSSQASDSPF